MARRFTLPVSAARLLAALAFGFISSAASAQIADLGVPAVTKLWQAEHIDHGTPVVLIETGPYAGDNAEQALVKLNVVAILTALDALASGAVNDVDVGLYTVIIRNASIVPGTGVAPFTGDIALDSTRAVREPETGGERREVQAFCVADLGDMRVFGPLEPVDATGLFAVASEEWKAGDTVQIPDWSAFRSWRPLAVGAITNIALLRPAAPGRFTVVRIIPAERALGTK